MVKDSEGNEVIERSNVFYIDNLAFAKIDPCGEPLDVNVNSIGQSDALVAWNGTTESYRVVLSEEAVAETLWEDYKNYLNPESLVLGRGYAEPALLEDNSGIAVQFERLGYFFKDPDSTPDHFVFNKTTALKDSFKF